MSIKKFLKSIDQKTYAENLHAANNLIRYLNYSGVYSKKFKKKFYKKIIESLNKVINKHENNIDYDYNETSKGFHDIYREYNFFSKDFESNLIAFVWVILKEPKIEFCQECNCYEHPPSDETWSKI